MKITATINHDCASLLTTLTSFEQRPYCLSEPHSPLPLSSKSMFFAEVTTNSSPITTVVSPRLTQSTTLTSHLAPATISVYTLSCFFSASFPFQSPLHQFEGNKVVTALTATPIIAIDYALAPPPFSSFTIEWNHVSLIDYLLPEPIYSSTFFGSNSFMTHMEPRDFSTLFPSTSMTALYKTFNACLPSLPRLV